MTGAEESWTRDMLAAEALMAADLDLMADTMQPLLRVDRTRAEDGSVTTVAYVDQPPRRICSTRLTPLRVSYAGTDATAEIDYVIDWASPEGSLLAHFRIVETLRLQDGRWVLLERVSELLDPGDAPGVFPTLERPL